MATLDFNMAYSGGYEWQAAAGEVFHLIACFGLGISLRALPFPPSHNDNLTRSMNDAAIWREGR